MWANAQRDGRPAEHRWRLLWRTYCCLTRFFPIVDTCLICEDIAQQSCPMAIFGDFFPSCIFSKPRAARFRPAS